MQGSSRTKKGRSPIAGSHNLPDHWEYGDLIVLHGTEPDDPMLRVCIRGREPGAATWVDMKSREADRFARCIFNLAGYDVPAPITREREPAHWNVYVVRRARRRINRICIFNHGGPVHCRAALSMPRTKIETLAEWLATRLGWDLYEEAAA